MKHLLLTALILTTTATAACANDGCKMLGDLAEAAAKGRQYGVSMSTFVDVFPSDTSPESRELAMSVLIGAYSLPLRSSDAGIARIISDYRAAIELLCYRELGVPA